MIHILDAASTEGRDPLEDYRKINAELKAYGDKVASIPQIVAANKIDAIVREEEPIDIDEDGELIYPEYHDPVERIKDTLEPEGVKVFPVSAVTGEGMKELLSYVYQRLQEMKQEDVIFDTEYNPDEALQYENEPFKVFYNEETKEYVVEGPRIEKMLGYTNLESEKGFRFFQKFLKDNGILDELEALGISEGDTVRMYGLTFDYYK